MPPQLVRAQQMGAPVRRCVHCRPPWTPADFAASSYTGLRCRHAFVSTPVAAPYSARACTCCTLGRTAYGSTSTWRPRTLACPASESQRPFACPAHLPCTTSIVCCTRLRKSGPVLWQVPAALRNREIPRTRARRRVQASWRSRGTGAFSVLRKQRRFSAVLCAEFCRVRAGCFCMDSRTLLLAVPILRSSSAQQSNLQRLIALWTLVCRQSLIDANCKWPAVVTAPLRTPNGCGPS